MIDIKRLREDIAKEIHGMIWNDLWSDLDEDHRDIHRCRADLILALPIIVEALKALKSIESGKLVELDEDQSLPTNPYRRKTAAYGVYRFAVDSLLNAGFRKVRPVQPTAEAAHD